MISALVKAVGWDALECEYRGVRPAASRVIEHLAPPVCLLVVADGIALN